MAEVKQVVAVHRKACPDIHGRVACIFLEAAEYSRAVTPQIRQAGNRLSGLAETAYASLLA